MSEKDNAATLIFQLRTAQRLTQTQFGGRLGVSQDRVSRWERGVELPSVEILIRLGKTSEGLVLAHMQASTSTEGTILHLSDEFYRLAGVRDLQDETMRKATAKVIELIRAEDPSRAEKLQAEISDLEVEEALDRALQASVSFRRSEPGRPSSGLTAEDRRLLDETRKAIDEFRKTTDGFHKRNKGLK